MITVESLEVKWPFVIRRRKWVMQQTLVWLFCVPAVHSVIKEAGFFGDVHRKQVSVIFHVSLPTLSIQGICDSLLFLIFESLNIIKWHFL